MASIRERKGKSETTFAVLFNVDGKQSSKTFGDRKSAAKFAKLVEAVGPEAAAEIQANAHAAARTVDDLAVGWLEFKRRDLTTEGHRDYMRRYNRWIKPTLGQRVAEKITERDVQRWVDTVLVPNLGSKTVGDMHAMLHGLFSWAGAKSRGLVSYNPCKETDLPKKKKSPPRGLTIPELHALLEAAERLAKDDPGFRDAADVIAVMASTGWRPAEALSPSVQHVEVRDDGQVFLTMDQVFRRGEGVVQGGKTSAAARTLRVIGPARECLPRRMIGRHWSDPLFPNPKTGGAWNPNAFRRTYWVPIVAEAGLAERKPTPYWLRHTHVLLCVKAKIQQSEIQRRLGHESIQTTINVYGRMIDGIDDEAADRLEALLTPGSPAVVEGVVIEPPAELP